MSRLSTNAILQGMADALPTHKKDDDSSDLASSYEVVALLVHSYLAALDFKLCGFHQDKNLRAFPIFAFASTSASKLTAPLQPKPSLSLPDSRHNGTTALAR